MSVSLAQDVCCKQRRAAPKGSALASHGIRKSQHSDEPSGMKDSRDEGGFALFIWDFPAVFSASGYLLDGAVGHLSKLHSSLLPCLPR